MFNQRAALFTIVYYEHLARSKKWENGAVRCVRIALHVVNGAVRRISRALREVPGALLECSSRRATVASRRFLSAQ